MNGLCAHTKDPQIFNCEARWAHSVFPNEASFVLEKRNHTLMNILPHKLNCNISVFCFPVFPASHPHLYLKAPHLVLLKYSVIIQSAPFPKPVVECICNREFAIYNLRPCFLPVHLIFSLTYKLLCFKIKQSGIYRLSFIKNIQWTLIQQPLCLLCGIL